MRSEHRPPRNLQGEGVRDGQGNNNTVDCDVPDIWEDLERLGGLRTVLIIPCVDDEVALGGAAVEDCWRWGEKGECIGRLEESAR